MKLTLPVCSLFALALSACGPMQSDPTAPSPAPGSTGAVQQAQGGTTGGGGTSGGGGCGRFQFAANSLFYLPDPLAGESSFDGYLYLSSACGIPADLVVSFNGVPLTKGTLGWVVTPTGPQPQPDALGNLVITARSVSAQVSRSLTLPCAPDEPITANPAEGSSLSALPALDLSYPAALTSGDTTLPVSEWASGTLFGYDASTHALGQAVSFVYAIGLTGTSLPVSATASPGYAAELRYPGQYVLDGNSGGQCGRVKRLFFAK